jgi:hypothetical protein
MERAYHIPFIEHDQVVTSPMRCYLFPSIMHVVTWEMSLVVGSTGRTLPSCARYNAFMHAS